MKNGPKAPMPWDVAIFITVATMGLFYAVQKASDSKGIDTSNVRVLASDTGEATTIDSRKTIDLGCMLRKLSKERMMSEGHTLRFRGRFCHLSRRAMKKFDGIHIRNDTTGYDATIFFQQDDTTFVTDFIPMASGKNNIRVEWREYRQDKSHLFVAEVFDK